MVPKRTNEAPADEDRSESKRFRAEPESALPPLPVVPKGLELPSGWTECPAMGHRMVQDGIVPTKVPLGRRFSPVLTEEQHFSPERLVQQLAAKGAEVGLIIDLTNSWRYYDLEEVTCLGVAHIKIKCRGRGEAPEPHAVNEFFWELLNFRKLNPDKWVVVHCTHGYNRTGFMITNWLMRTRGMALAVALKTFAEHRPAGIYKEDYIRALYKYYHEPLHAGWEPPSLPAWKPEEPDSPRIDHELDDEENGADQQEDQRTVLQHDDDIGEEVPWGQMQMICDGIVRLVRNVPGDEPIPENWMNFPGSQPVSLDRQNVELLRQERYRVTWKADGTRYMLLIMQYGAFLVDRSFKVRRVQMRFPTKLMVGSGYASHNLTLLDGELVVDEDRDSGKHMYRYLAYDMMSLNGQSQVDQPWRERWGLMEAKVIKPREMEKAAIAKSVASGQQRYPIHYEYHQELFGVRQKMFYPLDKAKSLLQDTIPTLSHESDGLIFQLYYEPYVVGTDVKLLKWKFGHMNSVDFLLRSKAAGPELYLGQGSDVVVLPGAKVEFNEGEDARQYENCIVECSWDGEDGVWRFMRVRTDKHHPNAKHVYEKVMASIEDNIEEDDIIAEVAEAMKEPVYDKDRPPGAVFAQ